MRPAIVSTNDIDAMISDGAAVAIGVSGGKDSQAAALATIRHLDRVGHSGPRLLVHADLGSVEWADSHRVCAELAADLGLELVVVRRKAGGLMERWESRWRSSTERYESLSTVTLVPCWSTPAMRFCTSEQKTHVITAELRRRFKGLPIVNVTGVRRDESAARAKMPVASADKDGKIWTWRPLSDWSVADVFAEIDASGLAPHPAYRQFGMTRVSCRFCIMSSLPDMQAAANQPEAHPVYRQMVRLECVSTFAFQGARWLGDIAPHLLDASDREALAGAKVKARRRVEVEKRITKPMLYVKGWPTRLLTDDEADLLADVRREVSSLFGFKSDCLDRASIHHRYADLMAQKAARAELAGAA